jgi:hypothetical protein
MMNFRIRPEELSGKCSRDVHPICRDLCSIWFPIRNRIFVVIEWRRHSLEKSRWINFRYNEARIFRSALGEYAVSELALIEFGLPEIATIELTTFERDVTEENSSKDTTAETTILKCCTQDF